MCCRQTAGTGGIHHAVGSAKVQAIGDATRHDVAKQAWKRVFLPRDITVCDPCDNVVGDGGTDTRIKQRLTPLWVPEARAKWDDQLQGAGNTQNDTDGLPLRIAHRAITGVRKGCVGNCQTEQLRHIRRFQVMRRNAVGRAIKGYGGNEATAFGVGVIRFFGVCVVIVSHAPV